MRVQRRDFSCNPRLNDLHTLMKFLHPFFLTLAAASAAAQSPSGTLDPLGAVVSNSACPIPPSRYRADTVVIPVTTSQDIYKRYNYPITRHVTLEIQNDIDGIQWFLSEMFTNTTIVSKCGVGFTLTGTDSNIPIIINAASDVFIHALRIRVKYDWTLTSGSPVCTDVSNNVRQWTFTIKYAMTFPLCPSVLAVAVNRLQIVGNALYGKALMSNTTNSLFENNFVTTHGLSEGLYIANNGNLVTLDYSPVIVRNNVFNDTDTGIFLGGSGSGPAIGVQVVNNNFTSFISASVQFGTGERSTDAVSAYFAYNYIYRPPNYPASGSYGAINIHTHWFGVNHTIFNNYIRQDNPSFCIRMSKSSSGIRATRNICDGSTAPIRFKNGWYNTIDDLLVINATARTYIGCDETYSYNCLPGNAGTSLWSPISFTAPAWSALAPWAANFCNIQSVGGTRCNVNATLDAQHGNCSGLPVMNNVRYASIAVRPKSPSLPPSQLPTIGVCCFDAPSIDMINTLNETAYGDNSIYRGDDGLARLTPGSQLAADFPNLTLFDYKRLGVQTPDPTQFFGLSPFSVERTQDAPQPSSNSTISSNDTSSPLTGSSVSTSRLSTAAIGGFAAAASVAGIGAAGISVWIMRRNAFVSRSLADPSKK